MHEVCARCGRDRSHSWAFVGTDVEMSTMEVGGDDGRSNEKDIRPML